MKQYFLPKRPFFIGDCMPFYRDGVFYLYYLIDENHHQGLGGLGGHQWALATTRDLVQWEDHGLVLPITEPWEGSICTGSTFYHNGTFYAFYATRMRDWTEHLSLATSGDGVDFQKNPQVPFVTLPPGYQPRHCRDPFVFWDEATARFHMLVTTALADFVPTQHGGCLLHLSSPDLQRWTAEERPFLTPGYPTVPECADWFEWNGRYYLIFSVGGVAHYRLADSPLGPWRKPVVDTLDGPMARVMKTAPYHDNRRIGVAFVISLEDERDNGRWLWAGNVLFRELVQRPDGTLGTKFVPEMGGEGSHEGAEVRRDIVLDGRAAVAVATVGEDVGGNGRLRLRIRWEGETAVVGIILRAAADGSEGYTLRLDRGARRVDVRPAQSPVFDYQARHGIEAVAELEAEEVVLEVVVHEDLIDVCVGNGRCLINRFPEQRGTHLHLFCQDGYATVGISFAGKQ